MTKKTIKSPVVKPAQSIAKKASPARKAKAKTVEDSKLKKTLLSAPRALKIDSVAAAMADRAKITSEAASSFVRTTAFSMQNRVKTAMTSLNKIEKSKKTPSARFGFGYQSSMQPTSTQDWLSQPFNRFKIAFSTLTVVGVICGFMYSGRLVDDYKQTGDSISSMFSDKTWVDGMLKQNNGIPHGNDKKGVLMPPRMVEENLVPASDRARATDHTDILPKEATAPEAVQAPVTKAIEKAPVRVEGKKMKSNRVVKQSKAVKAKTVKAKNKTKAKVANK
jgi:hypothetical protein